MTTGREKLPHETPLGIVTEEATFFLTVCTRERGSTVLVEQNRPSMILDAVRQRNEGGIWFASVFLVMPDHVHGLIRFHHPSHPMEKAVLDFKRWTARLTGFHWKKDFFDHRLRNEESAREKADYILMNPVRAGLVRTPEDWPHRWVASEGWGWRDGPVGNRVLPSGFRIRRRRREGVCR